MSRPADLIDVGEIARLLREQPEAVARRYCSATGAYVANGQFYALSPGRPDRNVGAFYVTLRGPHMGRWRDERTKEQGDMLDLIQMAMNCDRAGAIREARSFLGLEARDPGAAERLRARRREQEAEAARRRDAESADAARREGRARRIWMMEAAELRAGDPVDGYLHARGLDLAELPWRPRAIRHHPALPFRDVDPETGEVLEGRAPAMVTAVTAADGRMTAVHRVWLEQRDGRWTKLSIPKPKKVLGHFKGAAARVWRGALRDGRPGPRLGELKPGASLVLCEGVEDALAIALLRPDLRVLAGLTLGNMAEVALPATVEQLTIAADNDVHPQARDALAAAVRAHRAQNRIVRVNRSRVGKDFADAVLAAKSLREWEGAA